MPIDHQVLLAKLSHFNFSTSALNWMTSHLADRKQCVVVNGVKSPYIDCTTYLDLFCFVCILKIFFFWGLQWFSCSVVCWRCCHLHTQKKPCSSISNTYRCHGSSSNMVHHLMFITKGKKKKTPCMMFSKLLTVFEHSGVFVGGEEIALVTEVKYLGDILNSTLFQEAH